MKLIRSLLLLTIVCGLSSCAKHFQIFYTQSEQLAVDQESNMRFHGDDYLDVYYDLWSEGGVIIFYLANKTNDTLFIDFEKSSLITNSIELNYYANQNPGSPRPYDDPNPSGTLSAFYKELPRVLKLGPQSGQWIEGYPITFDWFPMRNKEKYKTFTAEKSPLKLNHRISYSFQLAEGIQMREIQHYLWINAIKQMDKNEFRGIEQRQEKSGKHPTDRFYVRNPNVGQEQQSQVWAEITFGFLEFFASFF